MKKTNLLSIAILTISFSSQIFSMKKVIETHRKLSAICENKAIWLLPYDKNDKRLPFIAKDLKPIDVAWTINDKGNVSMTVDDSPHQFQKGMAKVRFLFKQPIILDYYRPKTWHAEWKNGSKATIKNFLFLHKLTERATPLEIEKNKKKNKTFEQLPYDVQRYLINENKVDLPFFRKNGIRCAGLCRSLFSRN